MKKALHYLLYPMWMVFYHVFDGMSLGIYGSGSYAKRIDRTTFKYEAE